MLSPLLSALRSKKTELKAKAASALSTLTYTIPGRVSLREAGGLDALLDVLLSNNAASPDLWEVRTSAGTGPAPRLADSPG